MKNKIKKIEEQMGATRPRRPVIPREKFVSTGCTVLDLAISGRVRCGIPKGHYVYFVGDSSTGKTWFAMSILAEASINPHFDEYALIHDNVENGALMDIERYFGKRLSKRLASPAGTREDPEYSGTTLEFYRYLNTAIDAGPCIYILDSMDALTTEQDEEKDEKDLAGQEGKGSYGTKKAKDNSRYLKKCIRKARANGSIIIIISQTRDKINTPFPQQTYGGGKALRSYAHVQLWTRVAENLTKTVLGKERTIGSVIQIQLKKNRLQGWEEGKVCCPFYRSHGLDDTGSCVDYLVDEGHWPKAKKGGIIEAKDFQFSGSREKVITRIEADDNERKLRQIVGEVWARIEEASAARRKNKYA